MIPVRLRQRTGRRTTELERLASHVTGGQVPSRLAPDAVVSTVCGFCATGCSLDVHVSEGRPVNLSPSPDYPVNLGMACPKGWESLTPLAAPDRLTTPMLRTRRGLTAISWDDAMDTFVERFSAIQDAHGTGSLAFLSTGQIPTEEMALLGALAKFGMGMVHGDSNTRQCMATSVVAYKECFGFDAPPYTYADLEESDVIVLIGSNLCITHPIMWERVCSNPHQPEIVVVDPRRTETAVAATQHVPLLPKSDLVLLYGLAHLLIRHGWIDRDFIDAHTTGFDGFAAHVEAFPPDRVATATGIAPHELERLAATIGRGERVSLWWTMGVNQSHEAVRTAQAIIAVALMTGNIGRPGTGPNSVTGQCNAMGSRLFGNTTSLLGGRDFADPDHRAEVATVLGIDEDRIPQRASDAYDQILEGIVRGSIRGLWVIATNGAHSWVNQRHLHDVLDRLDFLVVQDMYSTTATAARADLLLPAAGWGEKDGSFICSERRIGLVHRVSQAPGQALADFWIFKLIAEAWGCGEMFRDWDSPEAVFELMARLSAGRPCDFTAAADYDTVDELGGVQWPLPAGADLDAARGAERRLFADGRFFTPDGRARFVWEDPRPPAEATSRRYPLVLLTGRATSAQWHTETRTGKSPTLRALSPAHLHLEINPADAEARGIKPNDAVVVRSARGSVHAKAFVTPTVAAGQVFLPMHDPGVNQLTDASFDPYSRQPSFKWSAVEVGPPEPWDR